MSQGTGDRGVPRKAAAVDRTADRSYAAVGQALASVTNDPRAGSDAWFGFKSAQDTSWKTPPPPLDPAKYPNVTRADLKRFLKIVGHGQYEQLMEDRRSMAEDLSAEQLLAAGKGTRASAGSSSSSAQGDGLTQALQAVPAQYFKDDFSLQKPGVLQALIDLGGSGGDGGELASSIDRLSGYLESVETNLMREIGCRSNSMFEAAGSLQELHHSLCMNLDQIRGLREHLRSMDAQTYTSALQVSGLQKRRARLALALEQLGSMEEVVASRGALQCLLDAQDYAGALELLSNLRHLVGRQLSMGVRAFRETSPQVEETIEIVESLLSCEFLSLARHPDIHSVMERAISDAGADAEADMDDDGTGTMPHSHHIHGPSGGDARAAREQCTGQTS
ncbi:hypothetical protein FOA52_005536 [Chlamydomonas sp. UWO 241]|nr:hypothetical protein FOA52_005536 [Chlamydomonas sp. UWO 241]